MNPINHFFFTLYSHPSLIWKVGAALIFIGLAFGIFFTPSLVREMDDSTRKGFSALLLVYGIFRLLTFYTEYKKVKRNEQE